MFLKEELDWLLETITNRQEIQDFRFGILPLPICWNEEDVYNVFIEEQELNYLERLILIYTIAPLLCESIKPNQLTHTQLVRLLASHSLECRLSLMKHLDDSSKLFDRGILLKIPIPNQFDYKIELSKTLKDLILFGKEQEPTYSSSFPAHKLTVKEEYSDLIVHPSTQKGIEEIITWKQQKDNLRKNWAFSRRIKDGYTALFFGPPGTGKTMAAGILAKECNLPIYRIDLSNLVSKYIGETEKNLESIFKKAEHKNWILFFDEADAIFGKRNADNSGNNQYANQTISYLLQRIEHFDGLVILASNFKENIDDAFLRRFQSIVPFYLPNALERQQIWSNLIRDCKDETVDITLLAKNYELTGANIMNVVVRAALECEQQGRRLLDSRVLTDAIQGELRKVGRI